MVRIKISEIYENKWRPIKYDFRPRQVEVQLNYYGCEDNEGFIMNVNRDLLLALKLDPDEFSDFESKKFKIVDTPNLIKKLINAEIRILKVEKNKRRFLNSNYLSWKVEFQVVDGNDNIQVVDGDGKKKFIINVDEDILLILQWIPDELYCNLKGMKFQIIETDSSD